MSKSTDARPWRRACTHSLHLCGCSLKFGRCFDPYPVRAGPDRSGRPRSPPGVRLGRDPLSANWVWPSALFTPSARLRWRLWPYSDLAAAWADFDVYGHPIEVGQAFLHDRLPALVGEFNAERGGEPMPWLAALACCSAYDIALHDAYGNLNDAPPTRPTTRSMNWDLSAWLAPMWRTATCPSRKIPRGLSHPPAKMELLAWHLVGGKTADPFEPDIEMPKDNYPVFSASGSGRTGSCA